MTTARGLGRLLSLERASKIDSKQPVAASAELVRGHAVEVHRPLKLSLCLLGRPTCFGRGVPELRYELGIDGGI